MAPQRLRINGWRRPRKRPRAGGGGIGARRPRCADAGRQTAARRSC